MGTKYVALASRSRYLDPLSMLTICLPFASANEDDVFVISEFVAGHFGGFRLEMGNPFGYGRFFGKISMLS
jgi:hypothetical protein